MARVNLGDIFELETPKGKAYLHYIYLDKLKCHLIRVLQGLYSETPTDFKALAEMQERFMVSFPLSVAHYRKIVKKVGHFPADNFGLPRYMRCRHNIGGEFLGWHIVDTDAWYRQLVKELSPEQIKLSPWGIWNDTLLIERLVDDWSLEKWV